MIVIYKLFALQNLFCTIINDTSVINAKAHTEEYLEKLQPTNHTPNCIGISFIQDKSTTLDSTFYMSFLRD